MKVLGFYASFVYWTGIYSLAASSDVLNPIPEFEQSWLLKERIVPDLVSVIPRHSLIVTYEKAIVHFGNLMDKFDILDAPIHVAWPSKNNTFYTLIATGSDPPKKLATVTPEYLHWVLGNIPGKEWGEGENIKKYQGLLTGFHFGIYRLVFFMFEQPRKILNMTVNLVRSENKADEEPWHFSTKNFSKTYNLGDPIALNYCVLDFNVTMPWDDFTET
nr:PREDICTED: protein D1-like [Bemisia tabaci]XP_018910976.1 PREDICTED: protein D1-like [Bemisia tabaci]